MGCGALGVLNPDADPQNLEGRGVSVRHLRTVLLPAAQAAAHLSANVYEIEPLLISPRGKGVKCPRDGRLDSAYVDAIEPADVGPATVMLS